jgi:hypothetical protein
MARSSLAPFDCTTHGGLSTMDAEPSIVCGTPGGAHVRMKAVAYLTIAVYIIGLPTFFAGFLWKNWAAVQADQRLRERGEGDSVLTNPNIKVSRKIHGVFGVVSMIYHGRQMLRKREGSLRVLVLSCASTASCPVPENL